MLLINYQEPPPDFISLQGVVFFICFYGEKCSIIRHFEEGSRSFRKKLLSLIPIIKSEHTGCGVTLDER